MANDFHLTFEVRGVRPGREAAVTEVFARFIVDEGFHEESGDDPWEVEPGEKGALVVTSMNPVRVRRAMDYEADARERLRKVVDAANGAPCEVRVQARDAQFDAEEPEDDEEG